MIKRDRLFTEKQCQRVRSAQRLYTPDLSTCALRIFKIISWSSRGDDLHYAQITPPFASMITYIAFLMDENDRPKSTFLEVAARRQLCARRYIVCPSPASYGDPPATLQDRERRPETRPILKPRSVTKRTTPPSFLILHTFTIILRSRIFNPLHSYVECDSTSVFI